MPDRHDCVFQIWLPVDHRVAATAHELTLEQLRAVSPTRWQAYRREEQEGRRRQFNHPLAMAQPVINALGLGESPLTISEVEQLFDDLSFDDLQRCIQTLEHTSTFHFQAIASD